MGSSMPFMMYYRSRFNQSIIQRLSEACHSFFFFPGGQELRELNTSLKFLTFILPFFLTFFWGRGIFVAPMTTQKSGEIPNSQMFQEKFPAHKNFTEKSNHAIFGFRFMRFKIWLLSYFVRLQWRPELEAHK